MKQPLILRGVYDFPYLSIINYTDANLLNFFCDHTSSQNIKNDLSGKCFRSTGGGGGSTKWGST